MADTAGSPLEFYRHGHQLAREGRHEEAVAAFQHALALQPELLQAHRWLARSYKALGLLHAARDAFARVTELAPGDADAQHDLGTSHATLGEHPAAVAALRRALVLDPQRLPSHKALARSLRQSKRHAEAVDALRAALQLAPDEPALRHDLASSLIALGRHAEAVDALLQVLALDPHRQPSLRALGRSLRALGRLDDALEHLQALLQLAPDDAVAHHDLGTVLAALQRHDEALVAFHQALALDPGHAAAHLASAGSLRTQGNPHEALRALEQAAALDGDNPAAPYRQGQILLGLGLHAEALLALQQALARQPDHAPAQRDAARALAALGQHAAALEVLEKAIALAPDDALAHHEHGMLALALDEPARALDAFDQALRLAPQRNDSARARQQAQERLAVITGRRRLPITLCLLRPLNEADRAPLTALLPQIEAVALGEAAPAWLPATVPLIACHWPDALDALHSAWVLPIDEHWPSPDQLDALHARSSPSVGCVQADASLRLLRTSLLQAGAQGLLHCRELQPAPTRPMPVVLPIDPRRPVWVVPDGAGPDSRDELLAAYQAMGHIAHLKPLPDDVAALRRGLVQERPLFIHETGGASATLQEAMAGLAITCLATPAGDPAALTRALRAAYRPVACVVGGGIGNLIQTTPAIRRLAEHLDQPVDLILAADFPDCASLFEGAPWVGRVFPDLASAARQRFALVMVLAPFGQEPLPLDCDRLVQASAHLPFSLTRSQHETRYYLNGLRDLLGVPFRPRDTAAYFIGNRRHRPTGRRCIALHAGCKDGIWSAKKWPYFEALAERLLACGFEVLSLGGPGEAVAGTQDCTGLPLPRTLDLIAASSYLVCNDSGLMHAADALQVPLTTLFAPSSVVKNGPLATTSQVVKLDKDCAPCQFDFARLATCRCIGELSLDSVWQRIGTHMATLGIAELPQAATCTPPPPICLTTTRPPPTAEPVPAPIPPERLRIDRLLGRYSSRLLEHLLAIDAGHEAHARLKQLLDTPSGLLHLGGAELDATLRLAWRLGAQDELTRALQAEAPRLLRTYPTRILPLCECAATVLPPAALDTLLHQAMNAALESGGEPALRQALDAACRYASPGALRELLLAVDASPHAGLLLHADLLTLLGNALHGTPPQALQLPRSGLDETALRAAASPLKRVEAALAQGDRPGFIDTCNQWLEDGGRAHELSRLLRSLTQPLARLRIAPGEILYAAAEPPRDNLELAIILGDADAVERAEAAGHLHGEALVAWRSQRGDHSPLNRLLAHWLTAIGATPVALQGANRIALFESCLAGVPPQAAIDRGKVSVILCTWNPEPGLLELAVESVLRQSYGNLELIIVDDGSEARFLEHFQHLAQRDPRVRLLRNPLNAGPYHGRNRALAVAEGDFIAFQDADDVAHLQRLQLQVDALLAADHLELCFATHLRFDGEGRLQYEINPDLLALQGDGPVTALFRRRALDAVGPFAQVRSRGDVEMRQRIEACYGARAIHYLPAPLMYCSGGPDSLSNATLARHQEALRLFRRAFRERAWPPVVEQRQVVPIGATAIPHALRSDTPRPTAEPASNATLTPP